MRGRSVEVSIQPVVLHIEAAILRACIQTACSKYQTLCCISHLCERRRQQQQQQQLHRHYNNRTMVGMLTFSSSLAICLAIGNAFVFRAPNVAPLKSARESQAEVIAPLGAASKGWGTGGALARLSGNGDMEVEHHLPRVPAAGCYRAWGSRVICPPLHASKGVGVRACSIFKVDSSPFARQIRTSMYDLSCTGWAMPVAAVAPVKPLGTDEINLLRRCAKACRLSGRGVPGSFLADTCRHYNCCSPTVAVYSLGYHSVHKFKERLVIVTTIKRSLHFRTKQIGNCVPAESQDTTERNR